MPQETQSGKICYYANASNAEGTMGLRHFSSSAKAYFFAGVRPAIWLDISEQAE